MPPLRLGTTTQGLQVSKFRRPLWFEILLLFIAHYFYEAKKCYRLTVDMCGSNCITKFTLSTASIEYMHYIFVTVATFAWHSLFVYSTMLQYHSTITSFSQCVHVWYHKITTLHPQLHGTFIKRSRLFNSYEGSHTSQKYSYFCAE